MKQLGIKDFSELIVYRKAYDKSLEIHKETLNYPKQEQYELGSQMRRASKSICANIAEGFGKQNVSTAEFKRFLLMAIGSADETKPSGRTGTKVILKLQKCSMDSTPSGDKM